MIQSNVSLDTIPSPPSPANANKTLKNLPVELQRRILTHCDLRSLASLCRVNRHFNDLVLDKMHLPEPLRTSSRAMWTMEGNTRFHEKVAKHLNARVVMGHFGQNGVVHFSVFQGVLRKVLSSKNLAYGALEYQQGRVLDASRQVVPLLFSEKGLRLWEPESLLVWPAKAVAQNSFCLFSQPISAVFAAADGSKALVQTSSCRGTVTCSWLAQRDSKKWSIKAAPKIGESEIISAAFIGDDARLLIQDRKGFLHFQEEKDGKQYHCLPRPFLGTMRTAYRDERSKTLAVSFSLGDLSYQKSGGRTLVFRQDVKEGTWQILSDLKDVFQLFSLPESNRLLALYAQESEDKDDDISIFQALRDRTRPFRAKVLELDASHLATEELFEANESYADFNLKTSMLIASDKMIDSRFYLYDLTNKKGSSRTRRVSLTIPFTQPTHGVDARFVADGQAILFFERPNRTRDFSREAHEDKPLQVWLATRLKADAVVESLFLPVAGRDINLILGGLMRRQSVPSFLMPDHLWMMLAYRPDRGIGKGAFLFSEQRAPHVGVAVFYRKGEGQQKEPFTGYPKFVSLLP